MNLIWKCEENPTKHIVKGFVMEYFIGRYRKYLVIDKFKIYPLRETYKYYDRNRIININK